jgi:predicted secreted Zn-dependent protease
MATEFGDIEWVYYNVSGASLKDAAEAISDLPEAGSAEWYPHYDYEADGHGVVTSATVTVGWRITLPHWDGYSSAAPAEQGEWDRFLAALEAHERGHLDLAEQYLRDIDQQMVGHSARRAKQAFEHVVHEIQAASDAYDHGNDHGRNEGTIIDLDVCPVC